MYPAVSIHPAVSHTSKRYYFAPFETASNQQENDALRISSATCITINSSLSVVLSSVGESQVLKNSHSFQASSPKISTEAIPVLSAHRPSFSYRALKVVNTQRCRSMPLNNYSLPLQILSSKPLSPAQDERAPNSPSFSGLVNITSLKPLSNIPVFLRIPDETTLQNQDEKVTGGSNYLSVLSNNSPPNRHAFSSSIEPQQP
ncbi:hypothetical protein PoB_001698100 [Plakobranchus ocellatus]|uniref:Uncharacterized protein n=1 Tax=Plakobranchus ocellatus TaxID=259542 RepID=A0AAV3Z786_9GAST|nr:hypothetical protein PoB_001698100 [Plakobranchus ocellatus]